MITHHPLTDDSSIATCDFCHHIIGPHDSPAGHLRAAHPRRTAIAQERDHAGR